MFVLATAGHVDHGKSSLLRALSHQEPDRLPEEKRRGMTIDLNFVWIETSQGRVGIIDVPGHKRFLGNMIRGISTVDAAIVVVACDDGWMPQTEEHLQILKAFGIQKGIGILTKTDAVSEGRIGEVEKEVQDYSELLGFRFPWIRFSIHQKESLLPINHSIEELLSQLEEPKVKKPRLWVDRVFSPLGLGTVVTGTLREGPLQVGQRLRCVMSGQLASIKAIQSYHQDCKIVEPTCRVALQLGAVSASALKKGELIVSETDGFQGARVLDSLLTFFSHPPKKSVEVIVHFGNSKARAKLHLSPADRHMGRLVLKSRVPIRSGERVLLRTAGEERTLGYAEVVGLDSKLSLRKFHESLVGWNGLASGYLEYCRKTLGIFDLSKAQNSSIFCEADFLLGLASSWSRLSQNVWIDVGFLQRQKEDILSLVEKIEKSQCKNSSGVEIAAMLKMGPEVVEEALKRLVEEQKIRVVQGKVHLGSQKTKALLEKENSILAKLLQNEEEPIRLELPPEQRRALEGLIQEGQVVAIGEGYHLARSSYDVFREKVVTFLKVNQRGSTPDLKMVLGKSRKFAVLILERLDLDRVTYLQNGFRSLLGRS